MAEASHFENRMILEVLRNFQRYRVILEFFPSFFMTKNWFRTKKHSCKFSIKSIVKKLQIGSNIIFLMGMKIIHTCNFLTMKFYEKLQESFFVQNQFVIIKNYKKWKKNFNMADGSHLEHRMLPGVPGIFQRYRVAKFLLIYL